MSTVVSGPMFEPSKWGVWESTHKKQGAHYNTYGCRDVDGMEGLRSIFPKGKADEFNVCIFSTSGVHGMYTTIEEAEIEFWKNQRGETDEDGNEFTPEVTFLIIHPRIVCLRYGNCRPQSAEDFEYLKKLRQTSWAELAKIGAEEPENGPGST